MIQEIKGMKRFSCFMKRFNTQNCEMNLEMVKGIKCAHGFVFVIFRTCREN